MHAITPTDATAQDATSSRRQARTGLVIDASCDVSPDFITHPDVAVIPIPIRIGSATAGLAMFQDNFAVPKSAPHPGNAKIFIDWMMKPENAAAVSSRIIRVIDLVAGPSICQRKTGQQGSIRHVHAPNRIAGAGIGSRNHG